METGETYISWDYDNEGYISKFAASLPGPGMAFYAHETPEEESLEQYLENPQTEVDPAHAEYYTVHQFVSGDHPRISIISKLGAGFDAIAAFRQKLSIIPGVSEPAGLDEPLIPSDFEYFTQTTSFPGDEKYREPRKGESEDAMVREFLEEVVGGVDVTDILKQRNEVHILPDDPYDDDFPPAIEEFSNPR